MRENIGLHWILIVRVFKCCFRISSNVVKLRNKFHYNVFMNKYKKRFKLLEFNTNRKSSGFGQTVTATKKYWMFKFPIEDFACVQLCKRFWNVSLCVFHPLENLDNLLNGCAKMSSFDTFHHQQCNRMASEARRKRSNNVTITWFALIIYAWSRHGSSKVLKSICSSWSRCRRRRRRRYHRSCSLVLLCCSFSLLHLGQLRSCFLCSAQSFSALHCFVRQQRTLAH